MRRKIILSISIITMCIVGTIITSCKKQDNANQRTFGIFKVLDDDITVEIDGIIKSSSEKNEYSFDG